MLTQKDKERIEARSNKEVNTACCHDDKSYILGFLHGGEYENQRCKWVSVDEELPEYGKPVLIRKMNGSIFIDRYLNNVFVNHAKKYVTHWQSLPEPPQTK